ncbi:hypothetical protein AVEN_44003-1 [Araneus ventricosus]|uniref:Uncharacterized protein n=1 Tax=Araneus ventricosus TaxID=182803 RepID=A0A4Y2VIH0_ARAVE|nr:hypothetical protein AVEN_44003-1 [Araneus ventricosus]
MPLKRPTPFAPILDELIDVCDCLPPGAHTSLRKISGSSGRQKLTPPGISPGDKRKRKRSGSSSRPKHVPKKRKSSAARKKRSTKKASAGKKKGKKKK